jgi:hypothetical protein
MSTRESSLLACPPTAEHGMMSTIDYEYIAASDRDAA